MIKKILLTIAIFLFCASCGIKSDPEYKSQDVNNKFINLI